MGENINIKDKRRVFYRNVDTSGFLLRVSLLGVSLLGLMIMDFYLESSSILLFIAIVAFEVFPFLLIPKHIKDKLNAFNPYWSSILGVLLTVFVSVQCVFFFGVL